MAFGFPATASQYIPLNNLTKPQFSYWAIAAVQKLKWDFISINEDEIIIETRNLLNTWTETICITTNEENPLITSASNGNQLYDNGRNQKNIEAFLDLFYEVIKDNPLLELDENSVINGINSAQTGIRKDLTTEKKVTRFYSFLSPFIPTKGYFITPILINSNILIFIVMCVSGVSFFTPEIQDIIDWGGNYGPSTTDGGWWRLLSACFLHYGILHLVMNCYALAYVGLLLESYLKKRDFLLTYLFCGILASFTSLYWNTNMVSAGASGAIFGMFGIVLVATACNKIDKTTKIPLLITIGSFILLNIAGSFKEGVDGAAHVGGLVSGLLFGIILVLLSKKRTIGILIVTLVTLCTSFTLYSLCKKSKIYIYQIVEYQEKMQDFVDMEKMALESFDLYSGGDKATILSNLKDRGIYYWDENIALITTLDKLYLPEEIHTQNENLLEYCKLRKKYYELAYKRLNENSSEYIPEMDEIEQKINAIVIVIKKTPKK